MAAIKPLSIAIAGGGIGGLCLAIGLLRHPHLKVSVYEAASAFAEIGAGLALGPNAQRALALISTDTAQAFQSQATSNLSPAYKNTWLEFRCGTEGLRDGEVLGVIENETGQQTVHRAKFLGELVKLIPKEVAQFGKRLTKVEDLGADQGVLLHFADGTTAMADCLIGADGIHSTVRKHLLGAENIVTSPVFTGSVAYRGLIPIEVAREYLKEFAEDAYMWCGDGGLMMSYPIDLGESLNVAALRSGKSSWDEPTSGIAVNQEQLAQDFKGWGEVPSKMIQMLKEPTMWAMFDHLPAPYYNSGNIAMMGDAAHATTPYQGAGAGQAIEDALVLSTLFQQVRSRAEVAPALASYDAVRRPRTQKVVRTSRDASELFYFNDGFVNGDTARWRKIWDGRMNWIWDIDLVKQNADALRIYESKIVN